MRKHQETCGNTRQNRPHALATQTFSTLSPQERKRWIEHLRYCKLSGEARKTNMRATPNHSTLYGRKTNNPDELVLVPHKVAIWRLKVSRTSLWRAVKAARNDCPSPIKVRRRIFWREEDIEQLSLVLKAFEGRSAYEKAAHADRCFQQTATAKKSLIRARKIRRTLVDPRQADLFAIRAESSQV